ncbi:MAG: ribosome biogenesis GTP-binding protein YihA/YsxC [Saprospiraceae bacterium]|nr:ribosome biogenesis GTP-binding protein YihA/YsxC [Saprospiraceae bacterium]
MIIHETKFIGSFTELKQCPKKDIPEYAFIGRSNVGKSSLINLLCDHAGMAHVSSKPGKTQTLNYYNINENWHLVDLPGYGYAKISKSRRTLWRKMIDDYMINRLKMQCAFLLIDSCVPPQHKDLRFANWMGENQIPFVLVFTKTDRKKSQKNKDFIEEFETEFLKSWENMPQYFITSAKNKIGRTEILDFIEGINETYYAAKKKKK